MGRKAFITLGLIGFSSRLFGQAPGDEVAAQLRELAAEIATLRQELGEAREESSRLREEVAELRDRLDASSPANGDGPAPDLAEQQELLTAKVDDQYQTKVESSSKYRVKLSGLALLTAYSTDGAVNSQDLPAFATSRNPGESNGAVGASMRQSILGLEVEGPTFAGARTYGDLRLDFFGGFPGGVDGASTGYARFRTARFVMDWKRHSIEVGQEAPFISPLSPSSLVSTAYPAFTSSGNLWAWAPQAFVTHRLQASGGTDVVVQYGVLDPLTGEIPPTEYDRIATAGERSRMPAGAARLGFLHSGADLTASGGVGVYYSRQNWGFSRRADSWAVTADWDVPFNRFVSVSGELYRGRAIGGLGGGAGSTLLLSGPLTEASTAVLPIDSGGGWGQLKYKPVQRWEVNAAFGGDFPFQPTNRSFSAVFGEEELAPRRNSSAFGNVIYQPRTNLLFSVEYRRLWTTEFGDSLRRAGHFSVGAGVMF